jgi:glycosyltransferase 2 family protein
VDARVSRRTFDIVVLVAGLVVLVGAALIAQTGLPAWEREVFLAVNGLPGGLYRPMWPFMQYGTFLTIPVIAAIAFVAGQRRLALVFLISGIGIYVLAKVVKVIAERGRPMELLGDAVSHGPTQTGAGFPSGHAAVAGALAFAVVGYLSRRWIIASFALAAIVLFGRVYIGAHLPLDVIGGFALGAAAAAAVHLIWGVPRKPEPSERGTPASEPVTG